MPPLIGAYIRGIDFSLPEKVMTNSELSYLHPGWKMEEVQTRTGVQNRHWCQENETALDLGEKAARILMKRVEMLPSDIRTIIFCTQSPDYPMPPNACLLQHRLGVPKHVGAFDINLACSGYIYGLHLAKALIQAEMSDNILLVTAETYSRWMNPNDRGPTTLFGDAGAATIISSGKAGLREFVLGTDGGGAQTFYVPAGGAKKPHSDDTKKPIEDENGNIRTEENLFMNGAEVLDFVKREVPPAFQNLLRVSSWGLDDVDLFVFHQASQISLDLLFKMLNIPANKQFVNLSAIGNTVSASIPIALREAELRGVLKPGMRIILMGFGVGLSWGGCTVTWK